MDAKKAWILGGAVLFISAGHFLTPLELPLIHDLIRRFYYAPIFLGAYWFGLRGAMAVALLSGGFYLVHIIGQWEAFNTMHPSHEGHFNKYIEISIFIVFGALFGTLIDRLKSTNAGLLEANQKAQQSYEASLVAARLASLGQLSAGLAHEIRNPLAGVKSSIDVAEDHFEDEDTEQAHEFLGLARKEVDRAARLIDEFLKFARPRTPELAEVKVADLFEAIENLMMPRARASDIRLVVHEESAGRSVTGDLDQLKQLLLNLALNALQAAPEGEGRVEICCRGGPDLIIEVSDNGPGVDPEAKARIFDPFFTTRESGIGLGLSVCHRIVLDHGGAIEVDSPGQLGGATFRVSLPEKPDKKLS